jgi:hypothetical protein
VFFATRAQGGEMRKATRLILFVGLLFAFLNSEVSAQEKQNIRFGYGVHLLLPVSINDEKGMPLGVANVLIANFPLTEKLKLITELGCQTGFSLFEPNPQTFVALSSPLARNFLLGGGLMYRYMPDYEGGLPTDSHLIALMILPGVPIAEKIALIFPTGMAYNTTTEKWIGVFSVRLNFFFF